MILFQIFEQYWYLFVVAAFILIFCLPSIPEDDIFVDDENSTDEERDLLAKRNLLIEKKQALNDMSIDEYYEKAEDRTGLPQCGKDGLTYVDRELLTELKSCRLRELLEEIDKVSSAFIVVKKLSIAVEKLREADAYEAMGRELKMNINYQAQKEASALLKKAKKLRKMYS